jgi:aldose 1-epimerase
VSVRAFGLTADGRPVRAATIGWPGGLSVELLEFGAVVRRLRFPTPEGPRDAILNLEVLDDYERDTAYIGALVGRVANRIANGRFMLDGRDVQVDVNEPPNTLHGGRGGFNKRVWRFEDVAADGRSLVLAYSSSDGEEGFPGRLEVRARFAVVAPDTLEIAYEAETDAPTPVNLSQHLYFNLLGERSATILDHRLTLAADGYTPVGPGLIPTGQVKPVDGTPFDLRDGPSLRQVLDHSDSQLDLGGGVDLNWSLRPGADPALRLVAPDGAWMEIVTDQPGMQVYSGQKLTAPFVRHGALAIEPQTFPDAVNQPAFPDPVLRPGQAYRRVSRYRFGA